MGFLDDLIAVDSQLHMLVVFIALVLMSTVIAIHFKIKDIKSIVLFDAMIVMFLYAWGMFDMSWMVGAMLVVIWVLYLELKQRGSGGEE